MYEFGQRPICMHVCMYVCTYRLSVFSLINKCIWTEFIPKGLLGELKPYSSHHQYVWLLLEGSILESLFEKNFYD